MRTFFYPAKKNDCTKDCRGVRCSCRCIENLNSLNIEGELVNLTGGFGLRCDASMRLRSGDPIILYAADYYELDDLILVKDIFDPFKVILVFGSDTLLSNVNYHLLRPRYLTSLQGNFQELNEVLLKMNESTQVQSIYSQSE